MVRPISAALLVWVALTVPYQALADSAPKPCAEMPGTPSRKPKPLWKSVPLMSVLSKVEERGEAGFRLAWSPPLSQCLVETLDVGGMPINAVHATFLKDGKDLEDRLIYRFSGGEGDGARDVVVLFDPLSSALTKVHLFYVAEMRGGQIFYYAMFDGLPPYETLKQTVAGVLSGEEKPLAVVHWEPGAKEGTIDVFDADRLKR